MGRSSIQDEEWLHIRGQLTYHSQARISGTTAGLIALRDAINSAVEIGVGAAEVYASDGEGYAVDVIRCRTISALGEPPYLDEIARRVAISERENVAKMEKWYRNERKRRERDDGR